METTVTQRGQTAIPAEIRRRYNLKPHSKLMWLQTRNGLTIVPVSGNPIEALRGRFKGSNLVRALLEERKREREHEHREDDQWVRRHLRS